MSRFRFGDHDWTALTASTARIRPIGNPASVVVVLAVAALAGVGTAASVAATGSYLPIQYALPTYAGSPGTWFYVGGAFLLCLAVMGGVVGAGLVPTVVAAGAPVAGWAVNHFAAPITPHYAATFPVEMALLYGGLFGTVGYLLGRALGPGIRRVASVGGRRDD